MDGFIMNFMWYFCIMILDEEGLDWVDIEIFYYKNYNVWEKVGIIKVFVYNLENG